MRVQKTLCTLVLASLVVPQLSGCGSIFYPDRRGQIDGRLDPLIAGLDAVGLLFYIVPGVIALGVDFTTGAIYYPNSRYSLAPEQLKKAQDTQGRIDPRRLQAILQQETGHAVPLDHPAIQVIPGQTSQLAQYGLTATR